ncbi:MAG: tetratricopeptide repeat protein [Sideroxydans sp.]|nr:tetratricopeptide repeat protein [Sideroxydans sp.]
MMRTAYEKSLPQFRLKRNFHLRVKNVLTTSLFLTPCLAYAVGIGEAEMQSRLGEPLRVRVELTADKSEHIESACLSLAKPNSDEDQNSFLTRARISLLAAAGRSYVEIRTNEPFNEPFAMMRLQIKCPGSGMGVFLKTLAILPDLPGATELAQNAPISAPAEMPESAQPAADEAIAPGTAVPAAPQPTLATLPENPALPTNNAMAASAPAQTAKVETAPAAQLPPVVAPSPRPKAAPTRRNGLETVLAKPRSRAKRQAQSGRSKAFYKPAFRLKLSGSLLTESPAGMTSEKRKALLREQQKDQDADNQTAQYLTLLHQVKLLQEELESVKLQLAQLQTTPSLAASSAEAASAIAAAPVAASAAEPAQETPPRPVANPPVATPSQPSSSPFGKMNIAYFVAELFSAALIILLGMRFISRRKTHLQDEDLFQTFTPKPAQEPAPAKQKIEPSLANVPPSGFLRTQPPSRPVTTSVNTYFPEPPTETSEADLLMEEAELYNIHGHPDKAAVILGEIIQKYPDKNEARLLLLNIYSSTGKKQEFERAAQDLMRLNPDEATMQTIQTLERVFNQKKPLSTGETTAKIPAAKPTTPLDLEFELPSSSEKKPEINFEIPTQKIAVADINFDIPAAGPDTDNPVPAPSGKPNQEIAVDLDALMKNLK